MKHLEKTRQQKADWSFPGAEGKGNGELLLNSYRVSVWSKERGSERAGGDGCTTV